MGIRRGAVLEFHEEDGPIVIAKDAAAVVERVYGCLGRNFETDSFVAEIRGRR